MILRIHEVTTDAIYDARHTALWAAEYANLRPILVDFMLTRLSVILFPNAETHRRWIFSKKRYLKRVSSMQRRINRLRHLRPEVLLAIELGNSDRNTNFEFAGHSFPTAHHFGNDLIDTLQRSIGALAQASKSVLGSRRPSETKVREIVADLYERQGYYWTGEEAEWYSGDLFFEPEVSWNESPWWAEEDIGRKSPINCLDPFSDGSLSEFQSLISHEWRGAHQWASSNQWNTLGLQRYRFFQTYVRHAQARTSITSDHLQNLKKAGRIRFEGEGKSVRYHVEDVLRELPEFQLHMRPAVI